MSFMIDSSRTLVLYCSAGISVAIALAFVRLHSRHNLLFEPRALIGQCLNSCHVIF